MAPKCWTRFEESKRLLWMGGKGCRDEIVLAITNVTPLEWERNCGDNDCSLYLNHLYLRHFDDLQIENHGDRRIQKEEYIMV